MEQIRLCIYYSDSKELTNTGYFKPKIKCLYSWSLKAGLKCHTKNDCPYYKQEVKNERG